MNAKRNIQGLIALMISMALTQDRTIPIVRRILPRR